MLLLLGPTIFALLMSLVYGWAIEFIWVRLLGLDERHDLHFSITILLGLAALAGLLGIWSLFAGISSRALAFFVIVALFILIGIRRYAGARLGVIAEQVKALTALSRLALGVLFLYVFYLAASSYYYTDTGLYHAQAIHWIEAYRAVPGLANLHIRLGFNSSLFLLSAFWGFVRLGLHLYQVPGLVIFISLSLYCFSLVEKFRETPAAGLSPVLASGVILFVLLRNDILPLLSSPMTDLSTAMIIWVVLLLMMEKVESGSLDRLDAQGLAVGMLSCLAITFKASAMPVLLAPLALGYLVRRSVRFSHILAFSVSFLLVIGPWIARNIILTGYLLFPLAGIDILHVDWKVPVSWVKQVSSAISAWGRISSLPAATVMSMKLNQWLPMWYLHQIPSNMFLISASVVGSVASVVYGLLHRPFAVLIGKYAAVFAVVITGVAFWFVQAPSVRFGFGFLVPLLILVFYAPVIVLLLRSIGESAAAPSRWLLSIAQVLVLLIVLALLLQSPSDLWRDYLLIPRKYPSVALGSVALHNQTIYYPLEGDQCWYDAFPCSPQVSPRLSLRGSGLDDGFYVRSK